MCVHLLKAVDGQMQLLRSTNAIGLILETHRKMASSKNFQEIGKIDLHEEWDYRYFLDIIDCCFPSQMYTFFQLMPLCWHLSFYCCSQNQTPSISWRSALAPERLLRYDVSRA